jgi:multiple sugar transport system permease protein/alpha-1,4-digalacturonate transport system permease protein
MVDIAVDTADASRAPRPRRRRSKLVLRNTLRGWSFILPNFAGFAALTLFPVIMLFWYSTTDYNVFGKGRFIGIENFVQLVSDPQFQKALVNTVYFAVMNVPLTIIVSLGLALLLNSKIRGVAFFRTAAFFPYVTSIVAIAVVWNLLFSPDYGPINQALRAIGIAHPPGWLTSPASAMPSVVIVNIWREMGYYMILFLAGLGTIPRELYEAARVDGANAWARFRFVTLPGLRPTMFFVTVILTIQSFKIFDLMLVLTGGGPGDATTVLAQFIYNKGFVENKFGYASAASVVLFFLCLLVTLVQWFVNKRRDAR